MRAQRLARVHAVAVNDIEHAGRQARLRRELAKARDGQRRELAHLQHRRVAEGETGRDLPGRGHERHIPRADQRAHPHRMVERVVEMGRRRIRIAVDARAHLGEIVEIVRGARHELLACLCNHLAGVARLDVGDFRHVLRDEVAQLHHHGRALGRGQRGPFRKGGLGGGHGGIDLGGGSCRELG